jgi:hypothetical protein
VVVLLLIGVGVFGVLYLTDTIKLGEASIGAGAVVGVAAILALLK